MRVTVVVIACVAATSGLFGLLASMTLRSPPSVCPLSQPATTSRDEGAAERRLNAWATGLPPVSAVLMNWNRPKSIVEILCFLAQSYTFIREVVVWDNAGSFSEASVRARCGPLLDRQGVTLLLLDSRRENVRAEGRYLGCARAAHGVCFFINDDLFPHYVNSLYHAFLFAPDLLFSNADEATYFHNTRWRFVNPDIDLYAGFAWVGAGAIVLRDTVLRALDMLGGGDTPARGDLFDNVFALSLNRVPLQLVAPMDRVVDLESHAAREPVASETAEPSLDARVFALETLVRRLREQRRSGQSATPESLELVYDMRAPCGNDNCLFLTSVEPFEWAPEELQFRGKQEARQRMTWESFQTEAQWASYKEFQEHPYFHAVDNVVKTSWCGAMHVGDYFGVDMLGPFPVMVAQVGLDKRFVSSSWESPFSVQCSTDGITWARDAKPGDSTWTSKQGVDVLQTLFPAVRVVRFIRWVARVELGHVCVHELDHPGIPALWTLQ